MMTAWTDYRAAVDAATQAFNQGGATGFAAYDEALRVASEAYHAAVAAPGQAAPIEKPAARSIAQ